MERQSDIFSFQTKNSEYEMLPKQKAGRGSRWTTHAMRKIRFPMYPSINVVLIMIAQTKKSCILVTGFLWIFTVATESVYEIMEIMESPCLSSKTILLQLELSRIWLSESEYGKVGHNKLREILDVCIERKGLYHPGM